MQNLDHFVLSDRGEGNGGIQVELGRQGVNGRAVAFRDGRGGNGGEEESLTIEGGA